MKRLIAGLCMATLAACSAVETFDGPEGVMTDERFAAVKEACGLDQATLVSGNRTTQTTINGIPSTITYEDADPNAKTIQLNRKYADGELAGIIICLNEQFERVGAEADIGLSEGQF